MLKLWILLGLMHLASCEPFSRSGHPARFISYSLSLAFTTLYVVLQRDQPLLLLLLLPADAEVENVERLFSNLFLDLNFTDL